MGKTSPPSKQPGFQGTVPDEQQLAGTWVYGAEGPFLSLQAESPSSEASTVENESSGDAKPGGKVRESGAETDAFPRGFWK